MRAPSTRAAPRTSTRSGRQANSNAWLIDGIDNNEFTFNTVIVMPSVEQVREFKVLSGVFSAEFGRGAGVVSVSTKSGTNQLHGTGYEFLRNDAFDARNFFVRKVVQPDGTLVKDPVPPLDRHQFGGALGGAVVIPGLYDGHSRTFFFADYAGIKERRGVTTVNTVPTAATRIGDFSNYRDRNGNLIPIYDPLTTRLDAQGRIVRDQFPNNIIPAGPAQSGRPEHRQHLPAAEHRQRQLRQLHLDARPGDHRQRVLRPRRSPAVGQRLVLRPVQLRQVPARRAAGPGQLLPADAAGGGRAIRPRPVRRRHPEHEADDARRGVQLLEGAEAAASSTSSASATPTPRRSRRSPTTATTPRNRWAFTASTSATSRPGLPNIGITNFTGMSGGPAFLPVNPSQFHYQIEDVLVWLKGRHQLKFGYRLVDRRPSPFIHDNTRSAINFGTSFVNNPLTNSGGTGLAEVLLGYFNNASRGFLLEVPQFRVVEQAAFVQDDFKVNNRLTVNAGLRYEIFQPADGEEQPARQLRLRDFRHRLRRRKRHQPQREQEDAVSATSRRAWA